jgi:hypothetical protein
MHVTTKLLYYAKLLNFFLLRLHFPFFKLTADTNTDVFYGMSLPRGLF